MNKIIGFTLLEIAFAQLTQEQLLAQCPNLAAEKLKFDEEQKKIKTSAALNLASNFLSGFAALGTQIAAVATAPKRIEIYKNAFSKW